ncbi:hypothetical protein MVEN_01019300 [Mycena venus]|uniref:ARM repeat-containing protein n=1 Tax=Mycena venus TaxID=2733690 RepID=A0A8H6YCX1_9AGAR|nr:hypothetical protein MVEN_01019300 [Mycena venus]
MRTLAQISQWLDGAQAVLNANILRRVSLLLKSPSANVQKWTSQFLGCLASHKSTAPAILKLKPCVCDSNSEVIAEATYALSQIALWLDGARAIVNAERLECVFNLLDTPEPKVRQWTCMLVGRLASHKSTAGVILNLEPCVELVSLLHEEKLATYALAQIALWSDGARAIVAAQMLDRVFELIGSPHWDVRLWACELVGRLAGHESTAPAILKLKPWKWLVPLLKDKHYQVNQSATNALARIIPWLDGSKIIVDIVDAEVLDHVLSDVVAAAMYALSQIAHWLEGAQAIVNAKGLECVLELFESTSPQVRKWTSTLVGELAGHEETESIFLKLKPCERLVSLVRIGDPEVIPGATGALSQIARQPDGAQAIIDAARILDHGLDLLQSPDPYVRRWTCTLVETLASHERTAPVIWTKSLCVRLFPLLRDNDFGTRTSAILAFRAISQWPDGAASLGDLGVFKRAEELSHDQSLGDDEQIQIAAILDNVARHRNY